MEVLGGGLFLGARYPCWRARPGLTGLRPHIARPRKSQAQCRDRTLRRVVQSPPLLPLQQRYELVGTSEDLLSSWLSPPRLLPIRYCLSLVAFLHIPSLPSRPPLLPAAPFPHLMRFAFSAGESICNCPASRGLLPPPPCLAPPDPPPSAEAFCDSCPKIRISGVPRS